MRNTAPKVDGAAPDPSGVLTAEEDNVRFSELKTGVTASGIALQTGNEQSERTNQLAESMSRHASGGVWYQDSGSVNTIVLQQAGSWVTPTEYFDGMMVRFMPLAANTGAATLRVDGLSAKPIVDHTGAALTGGDIIPNSECTAIYSAVSGSFILSPWSGLATTNKAGLIKVADDSEALDFNRNDVALTPSAQRLASLKGGFMAQASNFDLASSAIQFVTFDNAPVDVDGWFNLGNGRYTPQRAGWYQLFCVAQVESAPNNHSLLRIQPNGTGTFIGGGSAAGDQQQMYPSGGGFFYANGTTDFVNLLAYMKSPGASGFRRILYVSFYGHFKGETL